MPQVELVRRRIQKPAIWAAAGVVGVLVMVAGVLVWVSMLAPKTEEKTKVALNTAADKAFTGKNDEAIKALREQLAVAKTDDEKVALYLAIGSTYERKDDKKTALETYRQADKVKASYGVNESVARLAEATGDKALALEYYQRNLRILKGNEAPQNLDDLPRVEAAITHLGGKP